MFPHIRGRWIPAAILFFALHSQVGGQETSKDLIELLPSVETFEATLDVASSSPANQNVQALRAEVRKLTELLEESPRDARTSTSQERAERNNANAEIYLRRGMLHIDLEQFDEAFSDFDAAVRLAPEYVDARLHRAAEFQRRGNYVSALVDLDAAVESNPRYYASFEQRGYARRRKGDLAGALDDYSTAISLAPQSVSALLGRGWTWLELGDIAKAFDDLNSAIQLDPESGNGYRWRAKAWFSQEQFDKALADVNKAIERGFANAETYCLLAQVQEAMGKPDEAILAFNRAVQANPGDPEAFFGRAQVLSRNGKQEEALVDFYRAIAIRPDSAQYIGERGTALLEIGRYDEGVADILKAIELNPGDLGRNHQPNNDKKLSTDALKHGESQVRKMLDDRPAMTELVEPGDPIWNWAVRKFAGEDVGSLVDWNPDDEDPPRGWAQPPDANQHASVAISRVLRDLPGEPQASCHQLWQTAVFELYNVANSKTWIELDEHAQHGTISREDYIAGVVESELGTIQRTRAFFIQVFLPFLRSKGVIANCCGCELFRRRLVGI